jgi:hypothetical protein
MNTIQILNIAIEAEGGNDNAGPSRLAEVLGVTPQCIYNWKRLERVPHMPSRALKSIYAKQITKAERLTKMIGKE